MEDHESSFMDDFEMPSDAKQSLMKAIVVCAAIGGIYGAAIGSVVSTTGGAVKAIVITAGILALIGGILGARYGVFFGRANHVRFGSVFVGLIAAIGSAILGAFLAVSTLAFPGSAFGAFGGWLLGRYIAPPDRRFLAKTLGVFVGACLGAIILNVPQARSGAVWGLGIGAISGPMMFLVFIAALNLLPRQSRQAQDTPSKKVRRRNVRPNQRLGGRPMAKKAKKKELDPTLPIYQVKITLDDIKPPIWRQVQMDDCSLAELHDIIQISMGWDDEHMYAFVIEGEQYGDLERGDDFEHDVRSLRLSDLVKRGDTRFRYDYDFGDDWQHTVDIEKTMPAEEGVYYPRCVAGERACPPEDCGGPHGYPHLLAAIKNPKHKDHEEMLDWLGDDFDPEEFDLDEVNADLRYLRRSLGHRKGRGMAKAAFAKGDLVQVKPGIVHDQYPDIPLGGWVGNITTIAWLTPVGYGVRWTKPTLEQAHPVYLKRCQRDDIEPEGYWLEEDQLAEAADETPTAMEPPTKIITRPLSEEEAEDRVRMVFGITSDDVLPKPDEQTQRQFLDYLKAHLSFPFKADYAAASVLGSGTSEAVQVLGFADPPIDPSEGIVCVARKGKHEFQAPLSNIQVHEDDPNFRHVEDYTFWLWEGEEDDEDQDDEDFDEDFDEDEDEETMGNEFPIPEELMEIVNAQRQQFIEKFGRPPRPGDKLFFDAPPLEHVEHMIAQAMRQVGVDPAIVHAFEKTGLIVTEANRHLLKGADLDEWNAAVEEFSAKHGENEEPVQFPIGTVAFYGPDDTTTTKIVVGVIKEDGAEPIIKQWVASDVQTNPKMQREIEKFLTKHRVRSVSVSEGNMGCPHEEGEDFPVGGDCPFCPWWKGRQGSGARE